MDFEKLNLNDHAKDMVSWFLEWRIDRCNKKTPIEGKMAKGLFCHIFASISRTSAIYGLWGFMGICIDSIDFL